jgi:hypothetical protein
MEETIKKTKTISEKMCELKDCEQCAHRHHHHYVLRVVLTIFVVITAFWCGLKIGELKGFIIASQTSVRPVQFQMMSPSGREDFRSMKLERSSQGEPKTEAASSQE